MMKKSMLIIWVLVSLLIVGGVSAADVQINEIYYTASDPLDDYVELFVLDNSSNLAGWNITTFDGDNETFPAISNLNNFTYITIKMGFGIDDLDATDYNVTIYLGRGTSMLDSGDEVGLYDSTSTLVDFVRYGGGNGDGVLGGWSSSDPGISTSDAQKSLQLLGFDRNNSGNWRVSSITPGEPNIREFVSSAFDGTSVRIHNGLRCPCIIDYINSPPTGVKGIGINVTGGPGVDNETIEKFVEYVNFSLNLYNKSGFNPPQTGSDGIVDVTLANASSAGQSPSTGVTTGSDRDITIYVGFNNVTDKWTVEHELMHAIHGRNYTDANGTYYRWTSLVDRWKEEGLCEYWGFESVKRNFNLTDEEILEEAGEVMNYNISDFGRNTNINVFSNWSSPSFRWSKYVASFLMMRFIAETYGENKTTHIYKVQKNYGSWSTHDPNDVTGTEAVDKALAEEGSNKTFEDVFVDWTTWFYNNYNDTINYTLDNTVSDTHNITETNTLVPWGTRYEKIRVGTGKSLNITFQGNSTKKYAITLIKIKANGEKDREVKKFIGKTSIIVDGIYKEIILIKSQINSIGASNFILRVVPIISTGPPVPASEFSIIGVVIILLLVVIATFFILKRK